MLYDTDFNISLAAKIIEKAVRRLFSKETAAPSIWQRFDYTAPFGGYAMWRNRRGEVITGTFTAILAQLSFYWPPIYYAPLPLIDVSPEQFNVPAEVR